MCTIGIGQYATPRSETFIQCSQLELCRDSTSEGPEQGLIDRTSIENVVFGMVTRWSTPQHRQKKFHGTDWLEETRKYSLCLHLLRSQ